VKVGDLVKTKVSTVGIPCGTIGIVVVVRSLTWTSELGYDVQVTDIDQYGQCRYLYRRKELEVISESR